MTEILQSPLSPIPSSPSSSSSSINNDGLLHQQTHDPIINSPTTPCFYVAPKYRRNNTEGEEGRKRKEREKEEGDQLSLLAVLVTVFRKSLIACNSDTVEDFSSSMEIGLPTNVRHVAHVTFDRFHGFLGLPVEFEPEVPRRPPSASTRVFGVSTESMQLSFDSRGNSVPTILLMMQNCLYGQGGLQAEGIFRINAENGQEESVREQLNTGVVPDNIDMHCLAGLIKAWFRELPNGLLDSLPPEEVMQAQSEEECADLVSRLPPTEAALLDWAINLMTDVAQLENVNKMSPRNIAMVFAPNMTQMADPLTALMHAVQVMNFLRTLVEKTLREREDLIVGEPPLASCIEPSDDNGHEGSLVPHFDEVNEEDEEDQFFPAHEHIPETCPTHPTSEGSKIHNEQQDLLNSIENVPGAKSRLVEEDAVSKTTNRDTPQKIHKRKNSQKKRHKKSGDSLVVQAMRHGEKRRDGIASRLNLTTDRVETWR